MLSVGEILKRERLRKNITLTQVEKEIRVREKFLAAIEKNEWTLFSSKVYISGVIQTYAIYLGLDEKRVLAFFRRDYDSKDDIHFKEKVKNEYLTPQTKKIAILFIGLLISLFIVYFGYQLKLYLSPPSLVILQPTKTMFTQEQSTTIVGKTDQEAAVTIFGDRVYQDKDGIFQYTLPLKKGDNEVIIEIVGANGKKAVFKKSFTKIWIFALVRKCSSASVENERF